MNVSNLITKANILLEARAVSHALSLLRHVVPLTMGIVASRDHVLVMHYLTPLIAACLIVAEQFCRNETSTTHPST